MISLAATIPAPMARGLVRWTVSIHVAALLVQLATAIAFLSGWAALYVVHVGLGQWLYLFGLCQAAVLVGFRSAGRSPLTYWLGGALPAGEALQTYLGVRGLLAWHVTLAVLVWAGALAIWIRVTGTQRPAGTE